MRKPLNICQYTPACDMFGVNARFNLLFKEVCALKSNPFNLPIASSTILGGIKVGSGLSINSSTGVLSTTASGTGNLSRLPVVSSDFEGDGVTLLSDEITSEIAIFWNDINRYIYEDEGEWQFVSGGIEILIPGFDASSSPYHLEILITN